MVGESKKTSNLIVSFRNEFSKGGTKKKTEKIRPGRKEGRMTEGISLKSSEEGMTTYCKGS